MLSFEIGNTTVHLLPLLIVFLIAIIGAILHAFLLSKKNKELAKLCQIGKYNESIILAQKQLNYYHRTLKNRNTKSVMEMIYLHMAISYLGLSNDEQFIHTMTQVADTNPDKHFWLALFYLTRYDSAKFQTQCDILKSMCANENYLSYLSSIKKLQESNDADARNTLLTLNTKLNFKLLQDVSQKFINQ